MFISVFNQLDVQNLFHSKFYFMPVHVSRTCAHHQEDKLHYTASGIITPIGVMVYFKPLHVSSTCAHHQEVKIVLHSLWYHHTYRCDGLFHVSTCFEHVLIIRRSKLHYTISGIITPIGVMIPKIV